MGELKSLGTEQVCISGGEPLLYKDLDQLVRIATQKGFTVTLNTNGWLLSQKRMSTLLDAGLAGVNLSIDSPIAIEHDRLRNLPGLFERLSKQILECKEADLPFVLNIRMVLSKHNYMHVPKMFDLALRLHADVFSIDMIEADSKKRLFLMNSSEIKEFKTRYIPEVIRKIEEMDSKESLKNYNIAQIRDIFNCNFNPISNYEKGIYWPDEKIKQKCDIPSSFMIIEGDGSVLPCNAVEYNREMIVGNVCKSSITEVWNSSKWKDFRRMKMDYCSECPMNMSYSIILNDSGIEREVQPYRYTANQIKQMIKLDEEKEYNEDRLHEYISFFDLDFDNIRSLNEQYPIESTNYKINFLYKNFFEEMTNEEKIFNCYKKAAPYYSLRQLLGRPEKFNQQLIIFDFMSTHLQLGANVMDYGCCVGDFSILFNKMGFNVFAIDLDNSTFSFAKKRFFDRKMNISTVDINDQMELPNIEEKFDFIFCRDVLEHIVNPLAVLQFFYDHMQSNGYMYISTMNPGDEIYIGSEHLRNTILMAKTEQYKNFFKERFMELDIKGLYKRVN